MQGSFPSRAGQRSLNSRPLNNPTPYYMRALVLNYLVHHRYTSTARAFAQDCTTRNLDADGDEIMHIDNGLDDSSPELTEEVLRLVGLREQIRAKILAGQVDEATDLLNAHFPTVLSQPTTMSFRSSGKGHTRPRSVSTEFEYVAPTSVDPAHVSINLRILAFTEACRTIPLTPEDGSSPLSPPDLDPEAVNKHSTELLLKAQKLYASAGMLEKPNDRATYQKELENVSGLLAYKVPEESPVRKYLAMERREAVADQIDSAILCRCGLPAVSYVELYARYTSTIWGAARECGVKSPPLAQRPPGLSLPPTGDIPPPSEGTTQTDKDDGELVPPFDLAKYLDRRT